MKCIALIACWLFSGTTLINSYRFAAAGFAPSSVTFDGVNDRIRFTSSAVLMSSSGKQLTVCFWFNADNIANTGYIIQGRSATTPQWRVNIASSTLNWVIQNSTPVTIVQGNSDTVTGSATWHHVMLSIDTSSTSNRHIYIDGVDASDGWATYTVDGIMALDRTDIYIGEDDGGGGDYAGCLAELWVDDSYIDFSNSANRAKFFNAGDPVDLGSTGNIPTGSAPDLYMRFVSGSLGVNSGADGGTGTLTGNVADGDCGAVGN